MLLMVLASCNKSFVQLKVEPELVSVKEGGAYVSPVDKKKPVFFRPFSEMDKHVCFSSVDAQKIAEALNQCRQPKP